MGQRYTLLVGPDSFVSFQTAGQGYPPIPFEVGVHFAILVYRNNSRC